jgi:hypothetical protein
MEVDGKIFAAAAFFQGLVESGEELAQRRVTGGQHRALWRGRGEEGEREAGSPRMDSGSGTGAQRGQRWVCDWEAFASQANECRLET